MEPASVQRSSYTQRENMQSTFCGELHLNLVTRHGLARLKEKMVQACSYGTVVLVFNIHMPVSGSPNLFFITVPNGCSYDNINVSFDIQNLKPLILLKKKLIIVG